MTWSAALQRPARVALVNMATGERLDCLLNPTELSEKVAVNWNRLAVPGMSFQQLQYQGTGNRQLSDVEFLVDRFYAASLDSDPDITTFRSFLRSLTVPPAGTTGVYTTAPPRVTLVWPKVMTIEAVVASLEFRYRQFAVDGSPLVYTASVSFEEVLDVRVTSEALRAESA